VSVFGPSTAPHSSQLVRWHRVIGEECWALRCARQGAISSVVSSVDAQQAVELRNEANSVPDLDFIGRSRRRPIGPMLDTLDVAQMMRV
jgi:hypothetical protein